MVSSLSFSCLGSEETQRKVSATHTKPCAVTSFPNMHFAPPQTNFSFHYADPHYGGLLATPYLPHAPCTHGMLTFSSQLIIVAEHAPFKCSLRFYFWCSSSSNGIRSIIILHACNQSIIAS
ncbi:hypothetical protein F2Q70_00045339 [Brassica cretica]|uniref:Uncharacterized protein n=1 Tax=Brassica cretica TaxID=69181 RepID=A0A8S9KMX1_BRACR|nr:hypothetical protein F2Q70_00045339 [Brassica cretica]